MSVIALDVGGTKIAGALVKGNRISRKKIIPTGRTRKDILDGMDRMISSLLEKAGRNKIEGIGIGIPGLFDAAGKIIALPNLPQLDGFPLKRSFGKRYSLRTVVENDANCAVLGECISLRKGNVVCLTLGTGVGGGIVADRKLYRGNGFGGEIGHMIIDNKKSLEDLVSKKGILRLAGKHFKNINVITLASKARRGNRNAVRIFEQAGTHLGIGLANIVHVLAPEAIVLNGGISKTGRFILRPAVSEMRKRVLFKPALKNLKVYVSKLQEDAGLLGAASLV